MGVLPVVSRAICSSLILFAIVTAWFPVLAAEPQENSDSPAMRVLETKQGVRFVMRGEKGNSPKPTLVCLAHSGAETLQTSPYRASGLEVARQGWLVVSVDLPGHGAEHRVGEPAGIAAWGDRIKQNQPFVDDLAKRVSAVVDFLVQEGYADPARLAIEGTSRGGFMAAHVAAREPRFKSLAMYAPVCDLADVTEFHGLEQNSQLQALALSKVADKLADRRIWLIIGNDDRRVNTDRAIQFTRDVVRAAKRRKLAPAVTLIVPATPGHSSTEAMHHEAVEWLTRKSAASRP